LASSRVLTLNVSMTYTDEVRVTAQGGTIRSETVRFVSGLRHVATLPNEQK